MKEFIKHIQSIKKKRKLDGKPIDHFTMLHIVSTIGGKYVAKGIMTSKELDSIKYQGCGTPYLGDDYIFWEDEEDVYKEADSMEDLKYIVFDEEKIQRHYNDIFNEQGSHLESGYLVDIKICDREFNMFVSDNEEMKESRKYAALGDNQFGNVVVIKALKKLTKFLEMGIDIGFSSNSIE